ncbi:hypothetical protein [Nocardioides sp. InS609-2]|uniref:hypothetical protein n=1 Tax=Nocardioides sp. InS609-2 TaxID=2760705 RepID=UPI0020BF31E8|nr:hypothetical protein [Nocardioides sp. InS609-2]
MKSYELVWLRFPELTEHQAHWVLWELTLFPLASGLHDIVDELAQLEQADLPAKVPTAGVVSASGQTA